MGPLSCVGWCLPLPPQHIRWCFGARSFLNCMVVLRSLELFEVVLWARGAKYPLDCVMWFLDHLICVSRCWESSKLCELVLGAPRSL